MSPPGTARHPTASCAHLAGRLLRNSGRSQSQTLTCTSRSVNPKLGKALHTVQDGDTISLHVMAKGRHLLPSQSPPMMMTVRCFAGTPIPQC